MTPHPMYDPDGTLWNIAFATGPDRNGKSSGAWRYVIYKVTPPKTEEESKNPWLRLEIVTEVWIVDSTSQEQNHFKLPKPLLCFVFIYSK